eukprot:9206087-Alexandrium_andersonii.AAC.1
MQLLDSSTEATFSSREARQHRHTQSTCDRFLVRAGRARPGEVKAHSTWRRVCQCQGCVSLPRRLEFQGRRALGAPARAPAQPNPALGGLLRGTRGMVDDTASCWSFAFTDSEARLAGAVDSPIPPPPSPNPSARPSAQQSPGAGSEGGSEASAAVPKRKGRPVASKEPAGRMVQRPRATANDQVSVFASSGFAPFFWGSNSFPSCDQLPPGPSAKEPSFSTTQDSGFSIGCR